MKKKLILVAVVGFLATMSACSQKEEAVNVSEELNAPDTVIVEEVSDTVVVVEAVSDTAVVVDGDSLTTETDETAEE